MPACDIFAEKQLMFRKKQNFKLFKVYHTLYNFTYLYGSFSNYRDMWYISL